MTMILNNLNFYGLIELPQLKQHNKKIFNRKITKGKNN